MKRVGLMVILFAAFGLTACQNQTPTAPNGAAGHAPVSGVLHDDSGDSLSATLTASPSTINSGQSSTLTWTTHEAEQVYLDGVAVAQSGSKSVSPTATKTYTLVAVEEGQRVTSTATVTVSGGGSSGGGSCGDDDDCSSSTVLRGSVTATPATIQAGQASTLNWTSSNATAVYLDGASVALNGSKSVSPTATTTYNLVAINGANKVTSSATVTVSATPPPVAMPTASVTASSMTIQSGQSVTLTWGTTNATSATMNGSTVALNGSQAFSPTATTTYTLVATNSAGSATATATVTVTAPPPPVPMPTASLTASAATIQSGQSVTLTWGTTNATSATMNGTTVALNGSQAFSPTATTTYTLVATNSAGSVTRTATVTVTAPPPPVPMPTALLNAMPAAIQSGQSTTLQWASSNATTTTLDGSPVSASGSRVVSPTATTTYTLVASNASGSAQSTVTVTVTAPPPPVTPLTYMTDIKPIMDSNCIMCHGGPFPTAGRDFSTYAGVMTVVTPGDPNSRIIQMTMPGGPMNGFLNPDPLGKADIIYRWIVNFGAPQQ